MEATRVSRDPSGPPSSPRHRREHGRVVAERLALVPLRHALREHPTPRESLPVSPSLLHRIFVVRRLRRGRRPFPEVEHVIESRLRLDATVSRRASAKTERVAPVDVSPNGKRLRVGISQQRISRISQRAHRGVILVRVHADVEVAAEDGVGVRGGLRSSRPRRSVEARRARPGTVARGRWRPIAKSRIARAC